MRRRLIFHPAIGRDIAEIVARIERDSPDAAARVAREIFDAIDRLPAMPTASAIVPELGDATLRQVRVYDYRILFRLLPDAVRVLMITHGARELKPLLDERL